MNGEDFERKLPQEWAAEDGFEILDPDGWRGPDALPFDQPCTLGEFWGRFLRSTVRRV